MWVVIYCDGERQIERRGSGGETELTAFVHARALLQSGKEILRIERPDGSALPVEQFLAWLAQNSRKS